ncbi:MAG: hypothetical protein NTAFB05_04360 [Nitrobacter sp.]
MNRAGAVGAPRRQATTPARWGVVFAPNSGKIGVQVPKTATVNVQEHIAHIERAQEELRKFAAETRRPEPAPWQIARPPCSAQAQRS